jgi:uncharacterized membrane-anchored protein
MKKWLFCLLLLAIMVPGMVCAKQSEAQQAAQQAAWKEAEKVEILGPTEVELGDQAKLQLPANYGYIPKEQAANLLESMGNSADDRLLGVVIPADEDANWFVAIEYKKSGYIKDYDAKTWNVDDLLENYKKGTEEQNKVRVKKGFPEIEITGWLEKPKYDADKKQLVWSMSSRHKGGTGPDHTVNYNTYALGREGYISMDLVTGIKELEQDKPVATALLAGTEFVPGKKYEDFNFITDKVAEYGLAALIGGVAVKKLGIMAIVTGFILKFAKIIFIAVAAGGGLFSFLRRKKKKDKQKNSSDISQ